MTSNDREGNVLRALEARLAAYRPDGKHQADEFVLATLREALEALREGNYGIGAVLVDPQGEIVERGRNRVFHPRFRSDLHAEMDVMSTFEERTSVTSMRGYALYSSLECCPMCMTRLITSGVSRVLFAAPDERGGMVRLMDRLPQVWRDLAGGREWTQADCSPDLVQLSMDIFQSNVMELDRRLKERA